MPEIQWTRALCIVVLGTSLSVVGAPAVTERVVSTTEIPFTLYNDHFIIVKGTIGSFENVNIMLDTGKSPTAISEGIAKELNLEGNRESMLLSNGKIDVQSVVLPRILIGVMRAESIRVVVQDLSYMERKLGISLG